MDEGEERGEYLFNTRFAKRSFREDCAEWGRLQGGGARVMADTRGGEGGRSHVDGERGGRGGEGVGGAVPGILWGNQRGPAAGCRGHWGRCPGALARGPGPLGSLRRASA